MLKTRGIANNVPLSKFHGYRPVNRQLKTQNDDFNLINVQHEFVFSDQ